MAPDLGFIGAYQTEGYEEPDLRGLLIEERTDLPKLEQAAIAFISDIDDIAKEMVDPTLHDYLHVTGVLIDRANGDDNDESINCMPLGYLSNYGMPTGVAAVAVMGRTVAIADVGLYNDNVSDRLQLTPRVEYYRRYYLPFKDPTKFHYVMPRSIEDIHEFIFDRKIPYFTGYILASDTAADLKRLLTAGDPKKAARLIAELRAGLNHAFTLPRHTRAIAHQES